MKNDNLKMTKIEPTEITEKEFLEVPIAMSKKEYEKFKKYDEDLIAKIIGYSVSSVNPEILTKTEGIKIQLIIKCD